MSAPTPLDNYLVVDMSDGIAGAYCTKMLADGGARVVTVEPPEGDSLRSWSASGSAADTDSDGALFDYLACSKESLVVDPDVAADLDMLNRLLSKADAVVWSRGSRLTAQTALAPSAICDAHPHLVVTAITPFGLEGPWSERAATEFTLQAWSGGIVGLGRGAPDRAPVHVGGRIGEWFAGAYAAAATMTSVLRGGAGELVDLSMLETEIQGLTYHSTTFQELRGRPFRSERSIFIPGVSQASDGMVALGCATAQQWNDLCVMVGHPEWIDNDQPLQITTRAAEFATDIYAWISERTVDEVCEAATAFRIPNAAVGNGANLPELAQHEERGSYIKNPTRGFTQPGHPYRMSSFALHQPEPAPRLGEHTEALGAELSAPDHKGDRQQATTTGKPFEGMRVLDMTAFWAGPSCTHILATLGAEVIHVESTSRPDMTRFIAGVPMTDENWWEKSPIFAGLNTNKKGVTLNIQTEQGRELLKELVKTCDVLVENYTPRVLDQIGMDYESVKALRPDIIMVRMPGFGLDGPWKDKAAFAYVIEDASGLTWLTGHPDQNPVEPYSIGDPNAGIHALNGLLVALAHRDRTGAGTLVEASMIEAALNVSAEQVIEYSAYGKLLNRDGNRGPVAAPQNLYQSAGTDEFGRDDCWVAIAVETDAQWSILREALGSPEWALDPALESADGRRAAHDLIDEKLGQWCRVRSDDEIVDTLWDAGVPVAKVMQPHRQTELPQLEFRRFFAQVDHAVNGTARHTTLPIRFSSAPEQFDMRPAPLLGEHNTEILTGIGVTAAELDKLESDKVIGRKLAF
ncbi:CoA transferase [Gordonia sp. HNM0687]|uniref:CoA transferase n=1 Tax=Gordonia mangrovi TaxID=2665643 RepID=A0A6L7GTQ4_9ACTN|nr:CoA transferase [Gordonia mangrovi]MXP23316.1 CoA transferase [Gordonia mangrovi]UVF76770.1 CoA transferase [Gordonia mangrovi]